MVDSKLLSQPFFSQVSFFRDDLNHPTVSGNKLHKLAPNLKLAQQQSCNAVASFGGPYSNHLHALAWACKEQGIASIGLVRGELHEQLTPTLKDCQDWGMRLIPIQRKVYRELQESLQASSGIDLTQDCLPASIENIPDKTFVIPEGGSNLVAIDSLAKSYQGIFAEHKNLSHVVCATGTGATVAGLYKAAPSNVKVIGVQAVAEGNATMERIQGWLGESPANLSIVPGHLGGFAKKPAQLLEFIQKFETEYDIPLDSIYNGKVVFKLAQMANEGFFAKADKVLIVHTGGLQGDR